METIGKECQICHKKITFDKDGIWCGRCNTVFHYRCISQNDFTCSECKTSWLDPSLLFKYSEICSECGKANVPAAKKCKYCHTTTCWDTNKLYEENRDRIYKWGKESVIKGISQLGSGSLLLIYITFFMYLVYWYFFVSSHFPVFIFTIVILFIIACHIWLFLWALNSIHSGIITIRDSRKFLRFR